MPFTPLSRLIAKFFEGLGNGGILFFQTVRSPGAKTVERAVLNGIRPVINEARPAVQLA